MDKRSIPEELEHSGIAIIGMAGRFPGAGGVGEFWENLRCGVESISTFTREEVEETGMMPYAFNHPNFVPAGGVLPGVEMFDAAFFGYSPREAEIIDPQHRLFLECAWEALENAGHASEADGGAVGVFAGSALSSYMMNLVASTDILRVMGVAPTLIANGNDYLTTRVSYKMNLRGPSLGVQTACSTSLVAVHLACQSILNGECTMALAGGVTIMTPQKAGYVYHEGGINSPDGHCRAFDARALGTVGGNGVGVVVLKHLSEAIADGDHVHAVIRGSAINNDGSTKVGFTAPAVDGQAAVITEAQAVAGVEPDTIGYVEAHGTGTPLGDPVEMQALTQAFRAGTERKNFCAVGSVKSNVGHLDTAAGVTGLIKAALAVEHGEIPPSLHFEQPNPMLEIEESPFFVNNQLRPWPELGGPRRAGVSSFGMGGTNAHVVLEEAPIMPTPSPSRTKQLLTLSAKTAAALEAATDNLARHLREHPGLSLADVAYTLQLGRRQFEHRRALVCADAEDAARALEGRDGRRVTSASCDSRRRPITFMFSGQGSQYVGMGRGLYEEEAVFREQVDLCSRLLAPRLGFDLCEALFPEADDERAAESLRQTAVTQPALFVVEYALARLLMSWGVTPRAMIGHSVGEYVAACLAGVFSLEDALALTAARGALMQEMPRGAMLAVPLPEARVRELLGSELSLAAVNAPSLTVVSGPAEAVAALQAELEREGVEGRTLRTSHAFHSAMMEPILGRFVAAFEEIKLNAPEIPFVSNVTGTWVTAEQATDPHYWAQHLRQTVRFADCARTLLENAEAVLLEVGPGQTLATLARQQPGGSLRAVFSTLRMPRQQESDLGFTLGTLGHLWLAGVPVEWQALYEGERRRRVPLPTYPFERQRYWLDPSSLKADHSTRRAGLRKKEDVSEWFYGPVWKHAPRPAAGPASTERRQDYLVFLDERGVGAELAARLRGEGLRVITVAPGERFTRADSDAYLINPSRAEEYEALLADTQARGGAADVIVHCWNVTARGSGHDGASAEGDYAADSMPGFYSLLYLAQALGRRSFDDATRLFVVTESAQEVTGDEELRPVQAGAVGLCRVIPQEYPHIEFRSIDVVLPCGGASPTRGVIDDLAAELDAPVAEPFVAYRGKFRWVQSFEAQPAAASRPETTLLRERGVYLITGGLGRIGLLFADHLARLVRAKLILVGRTTLPAREAWPAWLAAHGEEHLLSRRIRAVEALEAAGAEVELAQADVADEAQMRVAVQAAFERFGALHGVVHAAGEKTAASVQETGPAFCAGHFRAKVTGTLVLEKVTRERPLDFCLLLSSLASVLGGLGYTAYVASNSVMDALARKWHDPHAKPWVSVNLDGWRFDDEAGTAAASSLSELTMTPEEGNEVLERALTKGAPAQLVVSTGDLGARLDLWVRRPAAREEDGAQAGILSLHQRPEVGTDYMAPRNDIERRVAAVWQQLLGIERIGVEDDFFALGGHSLLATQIVSRLRKEFHIEVGLRRLLETPTVAGLAASIEAVLLSGQETQAPPVLPVARDRQLPLSFEQQRLWFLHQLEPDNPFYNLSSAFRLTGRLDADAVEQSLNEVIRRHEALRTTFAELDGQAVQIIAPELRLELPFVDLGGLAAAVQPERVRRLAEEEASRPFALERGPLLRAMLLRLSDESHVLVFSVHHIIYDWWSTGVLIRELTVLYEAFSAGNPSPLPELAVQYADYAVWQREWLQGEVLETQLGYWRKQLGGELPVLDLPTDKPRPQLQTFNGSSQQIELPASLGKALEELCRAEGVTPFMALLAAFKLLLHRYTGQGDILVGTPVAGRTRAEVEGLIGFFVNTLVLRTRLEGGLSFRELLGRVREVTLGAYAHQELPFERLVEELQPARDLSRTPIFQVAMAHQQEGSNRLRLSEIEISQMEVESHSAKFDLTLYVTESDGGLSAMFEYNTDLFEAETVRRMAAHFGRLLESAVEDPQRSLSELPLLTPAERRELVVEWNSTEAGYPYEQCLHTLFEQQVACTPDAVALAYDGQELTYSELNERANRLAHRLRALGVGPESAVGVLMERSVEMVLALLGVLKAGGAYMPLEPSYPRERLSLILEDAGAPVLLTQQRLRALLPEGDRRVLELDAGWGEFAESAENPEPLALPGNAAYVIYTSGSTGRPKAVVNVHRAICNRLLWMQDEYRLTAADTVLQKTPFSFDVSVWEFFWPLLAGARLVVARPGGHQDTAYLAGLITQARVTVMHFVPAMLQVFLEEEGVERCDSLRDVICSGEALPYGLQERFFSRLRARLHNLYGPTEAAVDVTYWECRSGDGRGVVPIGRPIANTQIYLLDERMEPAPVGVAGELHIGGVGLARGYLGQPDLTAERFVPDPFSEGMGSRLYRTGDLARYLADGSIEFLGRLDHQVKLRGFRIELSEVEAVARTHEAVAESVVTLSAPKRAGYEAGSGSDRRLVCYVVPDAVSARGVRRRLRMEREGLLEGQPHLELPNGMLVLGRNRQEVGFMYEEIFASRGYLRHGIELPGGACVFDVGANVGLFTLFVATECAGARIYSFEPIPELYELLRLNADMHAVGSHVFDYGLGASEQEVTFTYYPNVSIISGRHADSKQEQAVVRRFLRQQQGAEAEFDEAEIAETVRQRLESRQVAGRLRPLSDVIREQGVEEIDLLKIDVEKSEEEVLAGLREEDWARIRQVVMEVHDQDGRVARVCAGLRGRGYEVVVEQDEALRGTGLYNLYARRPSASAKLAGQSCNSARKLWLSSRQLVEDLEAYLRKQLPEFMVPSDFVLLDELPLTSSGKVNRRALPEPERSREPRESYVAPRTPAEEVVAGVWAEVLGVERVGANDNFFALGGHSLLATRVVSRLKKAFPVELELRQIFDAPTVAGLAALLAHERAEATVGVGANGDQAAQVIPRREDASGGRLSFAQQRLWFLDQFEPGNTAYNMRAAVRLRGRLDVAALERGLTEVVRRHESLRTTIVTVKGEPRQLVHEARACELSLQDLSALPQARRDAEVERLASEDAGRPFDLSVGPLLRTTLLRLGDEEHALLVTMHHIISDGWSVAVFIKELKTLYAAYSRGAESELPEPAIQYADYAEWQRGRLQGETLERQLGYWREQLKDAPHTLELPTDRRRPAQPSFRVAAERITLSPEQTEALRRLSRAEGVTLFMTLLAAFKLLLYRYTGQEDVVVGTPVAGRTRDEVEGLIGFFINTLALRTRLEGGLSFRELLGRVREVTLGAYAHQELPFERLVEELQPARDLSRTPIFQVLFLFQNMPQEDLDLPDLKLEVIETGPVREDSEWVVTDLVLSAQEEGEGLSLGCKYDPDLFDAGMVRRLLGHLSVLVDSIADRPAQEISRLPMLTEGERSQLLSEWDRSHVERTPRCVHELFEEQAARQPEETAISIGERAVSYREVSERSGQIAHGLAELGVGRGQAVAVMLDDGALQVAALLGVLKAGAHFVCLDPYYPLTRLQQILAELAPSCVLASGPHAGLLREALAAAGVEDSCEVVLLEGQAADANGDGAPSSRDGARWFGRPAAARLAETAGPEDLAYVVYTSGSTGRPKGIMQSHDGLCQYVEFQARQFDIRRSKRVAQWASLTYDASYAEIFGALYAGATLCMTEAAVRSEPKALLEWLRDERVNVLITVPSFARHLFQLIEAERRDAHPLPALECLLLAGEALPVPFAREWVERFQGAPKLFNLYGPTESILATFYEVISVSDEQPAVPVGGAIDGRHILILDRDRQLAPVGGRGEIYIRSPYLTKGYLRQPEETAKAFIQNPLHAHHPDPVYRTGDLGRWLPGGVIELIGRADNQVKIRGMRVELEEIEAAAARHPGVAECAVVVREQAGAEPRLAAYAVPASRLAASELRAFLKEQLPAHMVPSEFGFLPSLPRTRSGKVDRRSLAVAEVYTLSDDRDFVAPRTEPEVAVAGIWQELLGVERVGVHDNFFDLGGHSLSATQVVNQLRTRFSVELQLRDFFESPTVAELALLVEAQRRADESAELEKMTGLLELVKRLPDSEVEKLLGQPGAAPEQHLE